MGTKIKLVAALLVASLASGCVVARYKDAQGAQIAVYSLGRKSALDGLEMLSAKDGGSLNIKSHSGSVDGDQIGKILGVALKTATAP